MPEQSPDNADPRQNAVLADLPDDEYERVVAKVELLDVGPRAPVYDSRGAMEDVYFPLTAVFSLVAVVSGEPAVEVGTIGREGMVGLPVFLGANSSPNAAFCQVPGAALRLSVPDFHQVLTADGALHRQLHRFLQATMVQLSQNVACNRLHSSEQRASRWLLMTADRVGSSEFPLTQEFLAQMLGVRRATVSGVATGLQNAGLIRYSRGFMTITDRQGLERTSCECYRIIRDEFQRIGNSNTNGTPHDTTR